MSTDLNNILLDQDKALISNPISKHTIIVPQQDLTSIIKQSVPDTTEIKDDIPAMSEKDMKKPQKTQAWKVLKKRYDENVKIEKLLSVAHVMRQLMQHNLKIIIPALSRDLLSLSFRWHNKLSKKILHNQNSEYI